MNLTVSDIAYLAANGIVATAYLLIATNWARAFRWPPAMTALIVLTVTLDAATYILDALTRFWAIFYRASIVAHIALAAVATVTAYTIVRRWQIADRAP